MYHVMDEDHPLEPTRAKPKRPSSAHTQRPKPARNPDALNASAGKIVRKNRDFVAENRKNFGRTNRQTQLKESFQHELLAQYIQNHPDYIKMRTSEYFLQSKQNEKKMFGENTSLTLSQSLSTRKSHAGASVSSAILPVKCTLEK